MSREDFRDARTVRVASALLAIMLASLVVGAGNARAAFGGEFADPSANAAPAASSYNSAAPCEVTRTAPECEVDAPSSLLPPADPNSPELYLNSAYWPAEERPDIEMYGIQQYGYDYENCSDPSTWNHYCFLVDAEAAGYPVSHTPEVGDLIVARCDSFTFVNGWTYTCGPPYGDIYYIGYVEQVFSDGSFIYTGGGTGPGDSGLAVQWLSGSMDAGASFIGFFPPGQSPSIKVTVDVDNGGAGAGTVSDSSGQTCASPGTEAICVFSEPGGVPVTFSETPASGSSFWAWYGACNGSGSCGVSFDGTNRELVADFVSSGADGAGGGTGSGTGSGSGSGTGSGSGSGTSGGSGSGGAPGTQTKPKAGQQPRVMRITASRGTIHATLSGSEVICRLARWTGRRWAPPLIRRCRGSVTYRHLTVGRYRLTVASGHRSVARIVFLRHGG